jgi:CTP synthase (UTP-ammonia lyase)
MRVLSDFDTSVRRSLTEIDKNWEKYPGLIICGTHSPKNVEAQIVEIQKAREAKLPFLGVCHGHQLAAIEYARHVLGIPDACSEEWGDGTFIVVKLQELKVGLYGGESYWNRFEVKDGFNEIWRKPESFFTAQYHPEYQSSKERPHPLLLEFLKYAKG